jgi:peptidyl-prolyl cis-trans isomerase SurA
MTLRISQFAAVCGLGLLALPGMMMVAQVPQYQSPLSVPAAPKPQMTFPTPAAISPNGHVVEDVVVRVNDQIITRSDIERSEEQLAQELQQTGASAEEAAERQKNMLRDLIDKQLLLSKGKELSINPDAEVTRRLNEIRKQYKLDSMEDLEKAARSQGVSFEDFKEGIRETVITQQVIRDEVSRTLRQPTKIQEEAFYEAHKQEYAQPEQVRLSEILIATPETPTDAQVAEAKDKAEAVEAKLKSGANFDDLAKQNSAGQTAAQGGDLGLFKRGALAKVLEDQTFDLKAGENTAPIRTRQGYVILKVTDHAAAGVPTMKEIEPQIQDAMYGEQMQPALRAYLTKQREQSFIDIKPGFVDSGASAKETKPVFTAYAPPVAKKKKVQQKKRFDRGGAFSEAKVGKNTAAAPAPVAAAATTPTATTSATTPAVAKTSAPVAATKATKKPVSTSTKPAKIKREKVRYGQAPRNSLPAGPEETASGTDVGAGAASAAVTPGGTMEAGRAAAPGTAIAPTQSTTQYSPTSDLDPLGPKAAPAQKTRYSDRAKTIHQEKEKKKSAKVEQKLAAKPTPITADEKATAVQQAAPLGLNGDTAKKKAKPKKTKGAPKERMQDKEKPATEKAAPTDTTAPLVPTTPAAPTPAPAPAPAPSN